MSDFEWRIPEHEVYERMAKQDEDAERRGPWPMPDRRSLVNRLAADKPSLAELDREDMDRGRAE